MITNTFQRLQLRVGLARRYCLIYFVIRFKLLISGKSVLRMERAIFGASEFFSQNAFITSLRGIESVIIGQPRGTDIDIVEIWYNPWTVTCTFDSLLDHFHNF